VTRAAALALLACVGLACSDEPVSLGPDPDFLWWSDHETNDLSDWTRGGSALGATYSQGGDVAVTTEQHRSGAHALRSTVTAPPGGPQAAAQIWRAGFAEEKAYYGAWFLLPAAATPTTYWVFCSFHLRTPSGADLALWDVKLAWTGLNLELALLHHDSGDVVPFARVPIPIGRWFQIEAELEPRPDANGRLRIWLDGALAFDVQGPTSSADAASAPITWEVGTLTDGLTPVTGTLYVDDAYVSLRQLGPGFPPFWRP
jgi:hypothetical protein